MLVANGTFALPQELAHLPPDPAAAAKVLARFHPADAAEALNRLDVATAVKVLEALPEKAAVFIVDIPHLMHGEKLIAALPKPRAEAILAGLSEDRRVEILRHLPVAARPALMARLDPQQRQSLEKLMTFLPNVAGGIMTSEFVSVPGDWTVDETLKLIEKVGPDKETVYIIYITDPATRQLRQVVSLRQLMSANRAESVLSIAASRPPVAVLPTTDREDVARLISKYNLLAVPVVAEDGHLMGIVTVDDVIDAIIEESTEDVQKMGGMEALDRPYLQINFLSMIRKRAGWLCALFLSEMLTASAMQHFEGTIERAVVLSLFIPLIMSSGGNSGSQATSLIIRAMALREVKLKDWWLVASRELPAGIALGVILGAIGILRIASWQLLGFYNYGANWPLIALTVGLALVAIVTWGSLTGSMLPFILKRLNFDPASASAPFVATLVDVTGIVIYFSVAYVVLSGTLL
jgi:magnesium transporter